MKLRQKIRLTLLYLIFLTFPITLNYFSVYLIIAGSASGVMTFSFFFWSTFFLGSLVFGRAACGYICPLGAVQETKDRMAPKKLSNIKYLKVVKYIFALAWVGAIISAAVAAGGYKAVNLLFKTESGISVDSPQSWFTYGSIVLLVLLPTFFIGKRGFCHYFCPWGVLNITATKIKNFFKWPSLNLRADSSKCKGCRACAKNCPMSLEPVKMVHIGSMDNTECILCGTCVDNCPNGAIKYSWRRD